MNIDSLADFITNRDWFYIVRSIHDGNNVIQSIGPVKANVNIDVYQDDDPDNPPYVFTLVIRVLITAGRNNMMHIHYNGNENNDSISYSMHDFEYIRTVKLKSSNVNMDDYNNVIRQINNSVILMLTSAIRNAEPITTDEDDEDAVKSISKSLNTLGVVIMENHDIMRAYADKLIDGR